MTNQEAIDRIEALLRERRERPCPRCKGLLPEGTVPQEIYQGISACEHCGGKVTDPRYQKAWELVTVPLVIPRLGINERHPHDISTWPPGAVRGMLEDVAGELGYETEEARGDDWEIRLYSAEAPEDAWPPTGTGASQAEALAAALIAALEGDDG